MIAGLWVFSILGSCCNFLTLFYIGNEVSLYPLTFTALKVLILFWIVCIVICFLNFLKQLLFCFTLCLCFMRSMKVRWTLLLRRQLPRSRSSMQRLMRSFWARFPEDLWKIKRRIEVVKPPGYYWCWQICCSWASSMSC